MTNPKLILIPKVIMAIPRQKPRTHRKLNKTTQLQGRTEGLSMFKKQCVSNKTSILMSSMERKETVRIACNITPFQDIWHG